MLRAGTARGVINPPLTIEQGVWGAKSHTTPRGIESDLWATCLVISDDSTTAAIIDLDLCLVPNDLATRIRAEVAEKLGIAAWQVRVSATHTHAGPVVRSHHATNSSAEANYVDFVREQCVGIATLANRDQVPVSVNAGYGNCSVGRSRRQRLESGGLVAGYAPDDPADPTVGVVRLADDAGAMVASVVHYAAHPTTLGYTNELVSPDYPGVTKRLVEQTLGGTSLFLQGAAGDIGPGPGGFLSDVPLMRSIGTQLGSAAIQTLLEVAEEQFDHRFVEVVRSGADLGVWSRQHRPLEPIRLQVRSETVRLKVNPQPSPASVRRQCDQVAAEVAALKAAGAPAPELAEGSVRLRRSTMALSRAQSFHGKEWFDLEIHLVLFGSVALIGVPIEPFSAIGKQIRARSPYQCTLFSGYANGANGYLPTREAAAEGGYEVDQMAVAPDSADRLVERVSELLHELYRPTQTSHPQGS